MCLALEVPGVLAKTVAITPLHQNSGLGTGVKVQLRCKAEENQVHGLDAKHCCQMKENPTE